LARCLAVSGLRAHWKGESNYLMLVVACVRFTLASVLSASMSGSIASLHIYVNTQKQNNLRRINTDETIRGKHTKQICPERSETKD
jgi:hypothetical protein